MRVYYLSDTHNDYNQYNTLTNITPEKEAVLVVAGDINSKGRSLADVEEVADDWKAIIYVAGNHDYWGLALHETHKFESKKDNVHFLQNKAITIEDVTFVGTTLWHPVTSTDEWWWRQTMNDCKKIRGKNYSRLRWHDLTKEYVDACSFIEQSKQIQGKKILVTHHALCDKSIAERFKGEESNKYYVTHNPELLKGYNIHIHGHVHTECDYIINGCNVLCNPRGYGRENPEFGIRIIDTEEL